MQPFSYHTGQREVQREANSVACADKLSTWVGPVADFAAGADLVLLASLADPTWHLAALSGPPPLVSVTADGDALAMGLPAGVERWLPVGGACGGIVINLAQARRSRVAGMLAASSGDGDADADADALRLTCRVAFTNCRKYMTPTASTGTAPYLGPAAVAPCAPDDAWLLDVVARGETAFLVTATPDGVADVSHRGGLPGFLRHDPAGGRVEWTEYVGDGMFVSSGNVRRRSRAVLLVLELASGDAAWLDLDVSYTTVRSDRRERVDALLQAGEPFPVQGRMTARVLGARRVTGLCRPRVRVPARGRITSADPTAVQHPR